MTASRKGSKAGTATKVEKKIAPRKRAEPTRDGHYVIIDGRRWRATDPSIPETKRRLLVDELMRACRDVGAALRSDDKEAELEARRRVHEAKVALGERGAKWWEKSKGKR